MEHAKSQQALSQENAVVFDKERAANYDQRFDKLAPTREALYLLIKVLLGGLPEQARILCVGAGTGAEILALAPEFPQWQFTAVEPAPAMLDVCRQHTEAAGVAARCTFHEGYLESLPDLPPFDAALCILVSHFLMEDEKRREFFAQIAARLQPEAYFVNADLTSPVAKATHERMLDVWGNMLLYSGVPEAESKNFVAAWEKNVRLLPPPEMESLLVAGGFEGPTLFYQTLFIHAWFSKRV